MEDFIRVVDLCDHFSIPAVVCINKWDINPEVSDEIKRRSQERGIPVVGEVPLTKRSRTPLTLCSPSPPIRQRCLQSCPGDVGPSARGDR
jgi:MinD superfamily P-loop ATPase